MKIQLETRDRILLGLYVGVFVFGLYTNTKIKEHESLVENLRQINKDTWTI